MQKYSRETCYSSPNICSALPKSCRAHEDARTVCGAAAGASEMPKGRHAPRGDFRWFGLIEQIFGVIEQITNLRTGSNLHKRYRTLLLCAAILLA